MGGFGVDDLLSAWLEARRFDNAHPDLRDYHARRLAALEAAFGVDLPELGDGPASGAQSPDDPQPRHLRRLFETTGQDILSLQSPFSRYLEAPEPIRALHARHATAINVALKGARDAHTALLVDLLELGWGLDKNRRVPDEDVDRHGFDSGQPPPDEEDYW